MRRTPPQVHKLEPPVARGWTALLAALLASAFFFVGGPAGTAYAAAATPLWPYTATVTSGPGTGQTVNLAHLNNITLEQVGARVVGRATLHVGVAGSPYQCLDGTSLNVFSFDGQLFVHNGLQGAQCTYGTWEIVPRSLTSPGQLPAISKAYVALSPLCALPPAGCSKVVVSGRGFGASAGKVLLIGYSASASGPVIVTSVSTWAPAEVVSALRGALEPGHYYDVVLFTSTGAAATTLVKTPRIVPLARP